MRLIAALLVLAFLPQDPIPAGPERIVLVTREEFAGELQGYKREGRISIKEASRTRSFPVEEVARVFFERLPSITPVAGERLRLHHGGLLTGKLTLEKDVFQVEASSGRFAVPRAEVKSIQLAAPDLAVPEIKDEKADVVLWRDDKELKAAHGTVVALGADALTLRDAKGETATLARANVRVVWLHQEARGRADLATGWFAKVQLKNGDKLLGILRAIERDRVVIFSHFLGEATFRKALLHSLTFVQYARMSVGNILLCEQNRVRELDRSGKEVWAYAQGNVSYPWAARKLENGNVLIANTNYNQVIEVRPKDKSGGDVVFQLDNVQYPYDVRRLENGNTLVAEYYANRVAEYEPKNKTMVWSTMKCNYPISAQRLENGNTLISSVYQVIEVNEKQEEKWRSTVSARPWRAERLDNGNTLIVDQQRGAVIEVDEKNKEVWRKDGLTRPTSAIRLDDGNTLILEQGKNQIIEVDPAGMQVHLIDKLQYPLHISTY